MAKKEKEKPIEVQLWAYCNKLRGNVDSSEYKHIMLSLIFLKYVNDKFDEHREKLIANGDEDFLEMVAFYKQDNVIFIPEEARWKYLMKNAKQDDITLILDTALASIEAKNPSLKGALPNNYFSRLQLSKTTIASLLDKMNEVKLDMANDKDLFGRIYEYFLKKFSMNEDRSKGEFYTPNTIVRLLCDLVEPYEGIVYDGACGSGGMFVNSMEFIEAHKGNSKLLTVVGQEANLTTLKLAKMNLAIRGINYDLGEKAASTFTEDQHKDLKADYILMNPPFNYKNWYTKDLEKDPRWKGFDAIPPEGNANYAWLLNMLSKLSDDGFGCMLLANGALSAGDTHESADYKIRKKLIEDDRIEAIIVLPRDMFYSTDISVTVWVMTKNKKARTYNGRNLRNRENEVLFIDYRQGGHLDADKYTELNADDRKEIADIYHNWQSTDLKDSFNYAVPELYKSVKKDEIAAQDYVLQPSKYIEFIDHDLEIDYEKEMARIQKEMKEILSTEKESQKMLIKAFEGIGYGIE